MDIYSVVILHDEGTYMFNQQSISLLIIQYLCPIQIIQECNIIEKLGYGSTADTYKVHKDTSLTEYVLKNFYDACNFFSPIKEYAILNILQSKNVQNFHNFYKNHDSINFGLILDYSPFILGEISYYQINRKEIFKSIVTCVNNAHEKGIAHRDLKPENIYLESYTGSIKIGDWGMASYSEENETKFVKIITTIPYRAPEIRDGYYYYKGIYEKADVWSLGIIFLQMCHRSRKFPVDMDINKCALADERSLIKQMLDTNPRTRITTKNILRHRYFQTC